jgi:sialate O-acetylesterase
MRSSWGLLSFARLLPALAVACSSASLFADVKLPPFISNHMVLQRESKAPLWGQAEPNEAVSVKFRDQAVETKADANGNWRVELKGLKAGGPDDLIITGKNTITLTDVLVGEVWVGSGQSNMQGTVAPYSKGDAVLAQLAATDYPQIRGCTRGSAWAPANPTNNPRFSAILFAFAVRLHEAEKVPVGMMLGAVGGTPSGAWLSEQALADDEPAQKLIAAYAEKYAADAKRFEEVELPRWKKTAEEAKAAGKDPGREPRGPAKPGTVNGNKVGYLYEAHIRPFVGYGIRGVLWDQGESGTALGGVDQYTLMGALIRGWRKEWNVGEFPFIYVQKPSGSGCAWDPKDPVTSQAQAFSKLPAAVPATGEGSYVETHVRIMTYPNVGMAISTDLGPGIHPTNKSGYGTRAAAVARGMVYGDKVEYYGPVYASHAVEGEKVRVKFTHVGQGLAFKHGDKLQGFAVAGEDKKFVWADAVIDGDSVVVSSSEVAKPAAVRYAFGNNRTWANLFNKDGLPAVTFRTDSW